MGGGRRKGARGAGGRPSLRYMRAPSRGVLSLPFHTQQTTSARLITMVRKKRGRVLPILPLRISRLGGEGARAAGLGRARSTAKHSTALPWQRRHSSPRPPPAPRPPKDSTRRDLRYGYRRIPGRAAQKSARAGLCCVGGAFAVLRSRVAAKAVPIFPLSYSLLRVRLIFGRCCYDRNANDLL